MKKMLALTSVLSFVVAFPELVGNVLRGGLLYDNWIEGVKYAGKLANDNSWKISISFLRSAESTLMTPGISLGWP
jgi:hypothetical protein